MADRKKQPKTKPRRGIFDVINALLTLVVVTVVVVGGLIFYGVHSFYAPGPIKTDTDFAVGKGDNLDSVSKKLEAQGLIDNHYVFDAGGLVTKKLKALKAGEYKLTANASMADVLKELTEGKAVQHGVTIPEGFTIAQVIQRLNDDTDLTGSLTDIPPEGGVLPQTYNFQPGASRQAILDQMAAAQQKTLADIWSGRDPDLPLSTPQQLVTLASIIEKETGLPSERAHVAAVFVNRLKKPMRLQSDPTVIYGITKGQAPLGRPLKRSEVEAVTPYNTYQVNGLPPTPIDNPGTDSLKAAANPDQSKDLYFVAVSTSPADGHIFAASYADQQMNVRKLRAAEKLAAATADAEADDAKQQIEAQQAAASGDSSTNDTPIASPPAPAIAASPAAAPAAPLASEAGAASPAAAPASPATPPSDASSASPAAAAPSTSNSTASDDDSMPDPTAPANDMAPTAPVDTATPTPSDAAPTSSVEAPPAATTPTPAADQSTPPPPTSDAPLPMPADLRPGNAGASPSTPVHEPKPVHPSKPAHPAKAKPEPADTFGG